MQHPDHYDAKERILNASIQLFSDKGFDGTSVSEIAFEAEVTKALIYYYFKSKEHILDYHVQTLIDDITKISLEFIQGHIVRMIREELLDIEPDKLHFTSEEAAESFMESIRVYYERILDYALEHRALIRILLTESLKKSKHHKDLLKLLDLAKDSDENPIFRTIFEADRDFNYSESMALFTFFYAILPLINFAAYYDDYKAKTGLRDEILRKDFLRSFQIITGSLVLGRDIMLHNKAKPEKVE